MMNQLPAAPFATGHTAELYTWAGETVLKLYNAGRPASEARRELALVRAIAAAGVPTPPAHGVIEVSGRHGVIFDRVDGQSMLHLLLGDPAAVHAYPGQLAALHIALLDKRIETIPSLHERQADKIRRARGLSNVQQTAALDALDALPRDTCLCHGDFHPGNVMLTPDGLTIIDWVDAAAGPAAADVARTLILMGLGTIELPDDASGRFLLTGRQEFCRLYFESIRSSGSVDPELVARWLWPVAVGRLSEDLADADNEQLLRLLARREGSRGPISLADVLAVGSG